MKENDEGNPYEESKPWRNEGGTSRYILGIDIGGTNTVYGLVDEEGRIVCRGKIPTETGASFEEYAAALRSAVEDTLREASFDWSAIQAVGIGAPCVDSEAGIIAGAVNLPWPSPVALAEVMEKVMERPVACDNDANAAAIGEWYFGAGRKHRNFIMLTLGTGVGSAIICDGRMLRGVRGLAGELGHVVVRRGPEARKCNCGRRGCLDAYVSARGVEESARELLADCDTQSILRSLDKMDARAIGEAAAAGDPVACQVMEQTGSILGEACAQFTAFSSPSLFIFFGGVAKAFPSFKKALIESFNRELLWVYDGQVEFRSSGLPDADAALLGAAAVGRPLLQGSTK